LRVLVVVVSLFSAVWALGCSTGSTGAGASHKLKLAATVYEGRQMPSKPNDPGGRTVTLEYDCDCFKSALSTDPGASWVLSYEVGLIMAAAKDRPLPGNGLEVMVRAGSEDTVGFEKSLVQYKCERAGFTFKECTK
jgi:hypothetical protein